MEKNPKNRLQEIIAKEKNNPPAYIDIFVKDAVQKFRARVEFTFRDKLYSELSDICSSKKQAQVDAARKGLKKIVNIDKNKYSTKLTNTKIKIYIDYENYQDDKQIDLFKKQQPSIEVIKFVNSKHQKVPNADKVVDCNERDATDIFIICKVAVLKEVTDPDTTLFVISRDKFASVLEKIYDKVYNTTSIEETYKKILQMN